MGNTHIFFHRLPALSTATLGSIAFGFALAAGLTCDFLSVSARPGTFLEYTNPDGIQVFSTDSEFGVACDASAFFQREGDALWTMSYAFWIVSLTIGGFAVILSWMLTTCVGPTYGNWRVLSLCSGIAAITEAPIFLMIMAKPCLDHDCSLSIGCIMLIVSVIFWTTMTLNTQCLDPPMWANELNAWRVSQKNRGRTRESRWSKWTQRRRWALGLSATESGSQDQEEPLEKMENGSYYADSNNSRLMLKVTPDGKRPGDDQKSVTSFGDLSDFFKYVEEQGQPAPMLGQRSRCTTDEEEGLLPAAAEGPKEVMTIHAHEESIFHVAPSKTEDMDDYETAAERLLLYPDDSQSKRCGPTCDGVIKIIGMKALAKCIKREPKPQKAGYCELGDDADADIEDAIDFRQVDYSPPMPRAEMEEKSREVFAPVLMENKENQELAHDWNTLHAAASAGIMLPRTISIKENGELELPDTEDDDGSQSELSLASFTDEHPDDEAEDYMSGSTLSSGSEDSNSPRSKSRRQGRRQQHFSCANSVASRRSLLELTIEEETDGDLSESDIEREKTLSQDYELRGVKSAPDRMSFTRPVSPYALKESKSAPAPNNDEASMDSDNSYISDVLRKTSGVTRIAPIVETSDSDMHADDEGGPSNICLELIAPLRGRSRSRSRSLTRRKKGAVHPTEETPLEIPSFRGERLEKAGIHFTHINVVSDNSSSDEEDSTTDRSFRSTVSRRARNARIRRLHAEKETRRRSRSLDQHMQRRIKKEAKVIFDPTLRMILVNREDGVEYGPDEASL